MNWDNRWIVVTNIQYSLDRVVKVVSKTIVIKGLSVVRYRQLKSKVEEWFQYYYFFWILDENILCSARNVLELSIVYCAEGFALIAIVSFFHNSFLLLFSGQKL